MFLSFSFTSLDTLSKLIDQFTSDLCKIEVKLAAQDPIKADLEEIKRELDNLSIVESLFKLHENDLNEMIKLHENLKKTIEKVRTKPQNGDHNSNDINKLTSIIKSLNNRWKTALEIYIDRYVFIKIKQ